MPNVPVGCRLPDVVPVFNFYAPLCKIGGSAFKQRCMFLQLCLFMCTHLVPCVSMYITVCVRASLYSCINVYATCVCACWGRRQASRFHTQSGSISSGRPQSRPPRGRLPTVGTSRDDCPRWGDCTCALTYTHAHSHTYPHTSAHTDLHIPMYEETHAWR